MISANIAEKDIEKHISKLKLLNKKLENSVKDVSKGTNMVMVRSFEKEIQKINDSIKLIEETGLKNIVEVKVYVYEVYNTVPGDLEYAYQETARNFAEPAKILKLKKIIDEISKEIEEFWYLVNA